MTLIFRIESESVNGATWGFSNETEGHRFESSKHTVTQDCEIGKKKSKWWMRLKLSYVHDTDMVIYLQKKTGKGHNIISSADCFLQKGGMGYIFIFFLQ